MKLIKLSHALQVLIASIFVFSSTAILFTLDAQAAKPPTPFNLNDSGKSKLFWPFENSSWKDQGEWVQTAGSDTSTHYGADYHAQDWALPKVNNVDVTCGQSFRSPLKGVVIFAGYTPDADEYGNQVIVKSDSNPNYALRITHLSSVTITDGQNVLPGDELGKLGTTGNSTGCHAHIVLYENINNQYSTTSTALDILDAGKFLGLTGNLNKHKRDYASKFKLNAEITECVDALIPSDIVNAIEQANLNSEPVTICLTPDSTYSFSSVNHTQNGPTGIPVVETNVTIIGNNATISRFTSSPRFRLFQVANTGELNLFDLTLSNGFADSGYGGGAIFNNGGKLNVDNVTFDSNELRFQSGNYITGGGAVLNFDGGVVNSQNSRYVNNTASNEGSGGAISNLLNSFVESKNDVFTGNYANNNGAAIYTQGDVSVRKGHIENNTARNHSGGIFIYSGIVDVRNTDFISNKTETSVSIFGRGAAIYLNSLGTLEVHKSNFNSNTATITAGAIYSVGENAIVKNSCFEGNSNVGVVNDSAVAINFRNNWWGAIDGPSPSGSGDSVQNVDFQNFKTEKPEFCI